MFTIGITGEARHGKGTVAKAMAGSLALHGFRTQIISFADPLKDFLTLLIGRSEPFRGTDEERNAPIPELRWFDLAPAVLQVAQSCGWLTPDWIERHPTGRQMMQVYGTTVIRDHFLHDAWVRIATNRSKHFAGITLIDDVRFNNEAHKRKSGGWLDLLAKVVRPSQDNGAAVSNHVSERSARAIPVAWLDGMITNRSTVAELIEQAQTQLALWGRHGLLPAEPATAPAPAAAPAGV